MQANTRWLYCLQLMLTGLFSLPDFLSSTVSRDKPHKKLIQLVVSIGPTLSFGGELVVKAKSLRLRAQQWTVFCFPVWEVFVLFPVTLCQHFELLSCYSFSCIPRFIRLHIKYFICWILTSKCGLWHDFASCLLVLLRTWQNPGSLLPFSAGVNNHLWWCSINYYKGTHFPSSDR